MIRRRTDLVVIGGGACGLSAALTAAQGGASVILLEKARSVGGLTRFCEGMFAVGTKYQREMKLPYTVEDRFIAHMNESKWQANPRLVRVMMERSAETIEWLESIGCEFTGVVAFYPGAPFVWHTIKAGPQGKHGSGAPAVYGMLRPMKEKIQKEKRIRVFTETSARSILRDKNGRIRGVMADGPRGEEIEIKAPCVLCATGGYGDDPEMMEKYVKGGKNLIPLFRVGQTGDSLKMAWQIGAARDGMGVTQSFTLLDKEPIASALQQIAGQPNLWVNLLGERYCDESIVNAFPLAINALVRQPGAAAYNIIDQEHVHFLASSGLQYTLGEYFTPGTPVPDAQKELDRGIQEGKVLAADTIAELANQIGCEESVLEETIREYNACCDAKEDFLFAKKRHYLHPVRSPRYYALKIQAILGITEGGIRINHKTEVIDTEHRVIPGLYAGGCAASGMVGDSYIMITSGGSLSFSVTSGRIAAENALVYMQKQPKR